jgi:hypothetical protein
MAARASGPVTTNAARATASAPGAAAWRAATRRRPSGAAQAQPAVPSLCGHRSEECASSPPAPCRSWRRWAWAGPPAGDAARPPRRHASSSSGITLRRGGVELREPGEKSTRRILAPRAARGPGELNRLGLGKAKIKASAGGRHAPPAPVIQGSIRGGPALPLWHGMRSSRVADAQARISSRPVVRVVVIYALALVEERQSRPALLLRPSRAGHGRSGNACPSDAARAREPGHKARAVTAHSSNTAFS